MSSIAEPLATMALSHVAPELQLEHEPFNYQLDGIKWLYEKTGALLADFPGSGKSMQAILGARLLHRDGKIKQVLIVCPKTLIHNWIDEFNSKGWWPQDKILVCVNDREGFLRSSFRVKIMHYEALARTPRDFLESLPPHDLVIADEIQRGKNPNTSTARAVKALPAVRRWALTGTPIENKIGDLASIMGFCLPGDLEHDVTVLRSVPYHPYIVRQRERVVAPLSHSILVSTPSEAARLIAPHMLRRRREEVLSELPEKFEQDVELDLLPQQRESYDRAEREGVLKLSEQEEITVAHIFQLIARLRQVCNFDPLTGTSCKIDRLVSDLSEVRASGHKALVFSQFVNQYGIGRIAQYLPAPLQIHGGIGPEDRMAAVRRFNTHPSAHELLLNYKCGGLGLNLQAAGYVFLFDRWWNPAVEDQAVHRALRIGTKHKVIVRKFVCRNTIEERILRKLAEKRRLFRQVLDEGQPIAASGLSKEEIFGLFNLKVRPRKTAVKVSGDTGATAKGSTDVKEPRSSVRQDVPASPVRKLQMGGLSIRKEMNP